MISISDSGFFANNGGHNGGAVESFGPAIISHCTFSENSALQNAGGAIVGQAAIFNSEFSGNSSALGGALSGSFWVVDSTLYNNAGVWGGSLYGSALISRTDIYDNTARYYGGGIFNGAVLSAYHSNITGNTALLDGGGIWNYPGATFTLNRTNVTGNVPNDIAP